MELDDFEAMGEHIGEVSIMISLIKRRAAEVFARRPPVRIQAGNGKEFTKDFSPLPASLSQN
jgi:hypothetical protein